jgi:hypothetical protein
MKIRIKFKSKIPRKIKRRQSVFKELNTEEFVNWLKNITGGIIQLNILSHRKKIKP